MARSSDGSRIPLATDFNGGKQDVSDAGGGADGSEQLTHGLLTRAAIMTLESRISPRRAESGAVADY